MEFELTDEQTAYQDLPASSSDGELAPFAAQWDEKEEFPRGGC